ncbi:hypothetical protein QR680_007854 [Steinernema hermaphroditum]|uniref:protein-serine/threonine phosphatase n=1 Tax=Steinernema hermaphroditum TaxID=289476 RepID=A0AA39M6T1_9BILA|nr:hypothetical protein QR680_007854 [Steinernema hermaphroditum]
MDPASVPSDVPASVFEEKRLTLLVDLDHTLIQCHRGPYNGPMTKDMFHIGSGASKHTVKIRPYCIEFLKKMSRFYVLHMVTLGERSYASKILRHFDPYGLLFSHRLITRDEMEDFYKKTTKLDKFFPLGLKYAAILDDRQSAWDKMTNVVQLKKYLFFKDGEEKEEVLKSMEKVLIRAHWIFYAHYEKTGELLDMATIVTKIRRRILKGVNVAISVAVPEGLTLEHSKVFQSLVKFGATVHTSITQETTVVLVKSETSKIAEARKAGIPVVTAKWLEAVFAKWEKPDFEEFMLIDEGLGVLTEVQNEEPVEVEAESAKGDKNVEIDDSEDDRFAVVCNLI